ncbi:MAG: KOW motif-containing protein [Chthoniobacterales bacterium]
MKPKAAGQVKDGAKCKVIGGTHAGKSGVVRDIKTSKTGHITITVLQPNGERFKTLAKNVVTWHGGIRRFPENKEPSQ